MLRSKAPIGVDIGSRTVKVCQLRKVGETYELEKFGMADIYPNGETAGDPAGVREQKIAALKQALENAGIKAKHSISAISGESIIVRYLQLPEMPEEELKKALQWEAEEYIPFRLSEVNLDSQILGKSEDTDHPKMDVLLVSAKKDMVANHVEILRGAGIEPQIVDVDSFAFLNCFELNHQPQPDECVALLNIGGEITSINIFSGGVSRFSRDIIVGGDTMTQAIKSRMGCPYSEAERLKMLYGTSPVVNAQKDADEDGDSFADSLASSINSAVSDMSNDTAHDAEEANNEEDQVRHAIQHTLFNLISEVRRSIEFFENQYGGAMNVSRVVLGGGTALLPNLTETLAHELSLEIEVLDPLRNIQISGKADQAQLDHIRHHLSVGIGLGLRGLAA